MSRNLAMTCCRRCRAPSVELDEAPRLITREEAGRYFDEYEGMLVANATCPNCQARYLAWVARIPYRREWLSYEGYEDLSYRSTFNDEPGLGDLPKPDVLREADLLIAPLRACHDVATLPTLERMRAALATYLGWGQ